MSDNLEDRGPRDRTRVDVTEDWELRYWSRKFGVTPETLKGVVRRVGPMAADVEKFLNNQAEPHGH